LQTSPAECVRPEVNDFRVSSSSYSPVLVYCRRLAQVLLCLLLAPLWGCAYPPEHISSHWKGEPPKRTVAADRIALLSGKMEVCTSQREKGVECAPLERENVDEVLGLIDESMGRWGLVEKRLREPDLTALVSKERVEPAKAHPPGGWEGLLGERDSMERMQEARIRYIILIDVKKNVHLGPWNKSGFGRIKYEPDAEFVGYSTGEERERSETLTIVARIHEVWDPEPLGFLRGNEMDLRAEYGEGCAVGCCAFSGGCGGACLPCIMPLPGMSPRSITASPITFESRKMGERLAYWLKPQPKSAKDDKSPFL